MQEAILEHFCAIERVPKVYAQRYEDEVDSPIWRLYCVDPTRETWLEARVETRELGTYASALYLRRFHEVSWNVMHIEEAGEELVLHASGYIDRERKRENRAQRAFLSARRMVFLHS